MIYIKKEIKFIMFVLIFIVLSPIVILYANGNIVSDGFGILKTGGIYISGAPIGSNIYLNAKSKVTTSFFQRDILIKNLRSGTYEIVVTKDGYNVWKKDLEVLGNLVVEGNAFILPEEMKLRIIDRLILKVEQDGDSLATTTNKNQEYIDIMAMFGSSTKPIQEITTSTTTDFKSNLGISNAPIMDGKLGLWKEKNKIYVSWYGKEETAPKYLCNLTECKKNFLVADFGRNLRQIDFFPGYDDVIIVAYEDKVFAVQIEENPQKIPQIIYKGDSPDFVLYKGSLYIKDKDLLAEVIL